MNISTFPIPLGKLTVPLEVRILHMNARRLLGLGLTTRLPETALQQNVHLPTDCKAVVGQDVKADHSIHLG